MIRALLNEKEINLYQLNQMEIKELKAQGGFTCPYCQREMRLKGGPKVRNHFAHVTTCDYDSYENESQEHLLAKNLLAGWLQSQGIAPTIEKPLPHIRRIADIYFEHCQRKYAFEIQKTAIPEELFRERTAAYGKDNITVIWIFIGDYHEKSHSTVLNRTMVLNRHLPLIHLDTERELLTKFTDIVWISSAEIKAQKESRRLHQLDLAGLLEAPQAENTLLPEEWLAIKEEFRAHKWQAYIKYEKSLTRQCQLHRTNLALLPAEIGWPINGSGFRKNIFLWQAYALMAITTYGLEGHFTIGGLISKIKYLYKFNVTKESVPQLKGYLELLVKFKIIAKIGSHYEYIRTPQFFQQMEHALLADRRLSHLALPQAESWNRQVG